MAEVYFSSKFGKIIHGDALQVIEESVEPNSVSVIMTSPPFGLIRKKDYGNVDATDYIDWFRNFGILFKRILKDDGSLVIDIGGSGRIKNLGEEINTTSILSYTAEGRLQTQKELLKNNVVFAGYNT
jgi:DNA modification methylase